MPRFEKEAGRKATISIYNHRSSTISHLNSLIISYLGKRDYLSAIRILQNQSVLLAIDINSVWKNAYHVVSQPDQYDKRCIRFLQKLIECGVTDVLFRQFLLFSMPSYYNEPELHGYCGILSLALRELELSSTTTIENDENNIDNPTLNFVSQSLSDSSIFLNDKLSYKESDNFLILTQQDAGNLDFDDDFDDLGNTSNWMSKPEKFSLDSAEKYFKEAIRLDSSDKTTKSDLVSVVQILISRVDYGVFESLVIWYFLNSKLSLLS
ncbi:hypothetical protein AYI69_g634 [Smittium culicis]|uniref:Uncharacterized protein n=1 Tax=Smittium culicis TaxID=133412 RepID=A0A1R1YSJ5_9FUNG|nr:hypothetical protein AYI69_g634 [Smittium culicis]